MPQKSSSSSIYAPDLHSLHILECGICRERGRQRFITIFQQLPTVDYASEPPRWSHFISNSLEQKNYQLSWILSFVINHMMETSYLTATVTKVIHKPTQHLLQTPAANQPIYWPSLGWAPPFYFSSIKKDIYGKDN